MRVCAMIFPLAAATSGVVHLRGVTKGNRTEQTPTDAYNAAASGFLDMGVGTCVMHDGSAPAVQTVSGVTCAPFCAISVHCMGYTKEDKSCKLFMSGPLQLGTGDALGHCYVKARPGVPYGQPATALHASPGVKLLAGARQVRTGGYNDVGEGMCELEDGSEPPMEMYEMDTSAECAAQCDSDKSCRGYSATDGGCITYEAGPLHANGMDAQDGFRCFQKFDEAAASAAASAAAGTADGGQGEAAEANDAPDPLAFGSPEERAVAEGFADHWKGKAASSADCYDGEDAPYGTQTAIASVCTENPDPAMPEGEQCECMVSKAHSCYILCLPEMMVVGENADYLWDKCMADCYPTPTCSEMCDGATHECMGHCVAGYSHVSRIFKDVFQGISNNIADFEAANKAR